MGIKPQLYTLNLSSPGPINIITLLPCGQYWILYTLYSIPIKLIFRFMYNVCMCNGCTHVLYTFNSYANAFRTGFRFRGTNTQVQKSSLAP